MQQIQSIQMQKALRWVESQRVQFEAKLGEISLPFLNKEFIYVVKEDVNLIPTFDVDSEISDVCVTEVRAIHVQCKCVIQYANNKPTCLSLENDLYEILQSLTNNPIECSYYHAFTY
jgi:hypothetical protein